MNAAEPIHPVLIAAIIASTIVLAEWLTAHTRLRALGTALLVILLGAVASNAGLIPTAASTPLYGGIFAYLAPLSIFWLLLQVSLRDLARAGTPMLLAFSLGTVGTVLGVLAGMTLAGGKTAFGEDYVALSGMFAGTYTGGSLNFNAIALEYGVVSDGGMYAGAVAIDNIVTALWMMACLAAPRMLAGLWPAPTTEASAPATLSVDASAEAETINPSDLAATLALGFAALLIRDAAVELTRIAGAPLPGMLILTALALVLAQMGWVQQIRGTRVLGMFSVYAFLTVIGALCSVSALGNIGRLGVSLTILAGTTVVVHGLVTFVGARFLRIDLATASIASQANIGGGTTALALASSLARPDLALPGILAGSLGTAVGTFIGFALAGALG